jgi:hypothetical protein
LKLSPDSAARRSGLTLAGAGFITRGSFNVNQASNASATPGKPS